MCQLIVTIHHGSDGQYDPYSHYNCPTEKSNSAQTYEKICGVARCLVVVKRVIKSETTSESARYKRQQYNRRTDSYHSHLLIPSA